MPLAGVRGQRMCVTVTSSLTVMPAHTHHVLYGEKQAFKKNKLITHSRTRKPLPEYHLLCVLVVMFFFFF